MKSHYYPRYITKKVTEALLDTPVVFIAGPRQSGKTTLAKSLIDSTWQYFSLDDQMLLTSVKSDPVGFIKNLPCEHVVIDEIQRAPELLISIKEAVDEHRIPGRFLLTGSSNALLLPTVSDSLAGRIEMVSLTPLSECEIQQTPASFLPTVLNGKAPHAKQTISKADLITRITTGCFPEPLTRKIEHRIQAWYKQYIQALIQKDIKDIEHIDHPNKMLNLLKLTAFYSGKLANLSELGAKLDLNRLTIKKYLNLLEQLFLVSSLPAWHTNEHKRLIKTPKLHLVDTGLICAMRNITQKNLMEQPDLMGALLESFVYNELQKQATQINEDILFYHYRDKDKVEIDCILETPSRECVAIEIKASATLQPKDFTGLKRFKELTGKRFKLGILLYTGEHTVSIADHIFAVPVSALWRR